MKITDVKKYCLGGVSLALGLLLSGCGGGGVAMAPPPPNYTKLANLSGNQTFKSASIQYTFANSQPFNYSSQNYGSGVVITYTASSDSYTLTAPDGTTTTFSNSASTPPPNVTNPPPTPSNTVMRFSGSDSFSLTVPTVNGVALSYTAVGNWNHLQDGVQSVYIAVLGIPTIANDMPKSGTASYQTSVIGTAYAGSTSPLGLQASSTATFSANFGNSTVATTLNLIGTGLNQPPVNYGSYSGTGTITSGGPGFFGTLASTAGNPISATGEFSGAFFGPQATEMGYAWHLTNGLNGFSAQGVTTGTK